MKQIIYNNNKKYQYNKIKIYFNKLNKLKKI